MPTAYEDQFYTFDPANPPPAGTAVTFERYEFIDQNDDGDIDSFDNDSVNGQDVTASWPGDTVTINVPGTGNVTYTGTTFYLADGSRVFTPTDGQVLENGTFVSATFVNGQGPLDVGDIGPTCFTPGVQIAVPGGTCSVEELMAGDLVKTVDNGPQRLREVTVTHLPGTGACAPVRVMAGALGNARDMLVSQQHRFLITGWKAELLYGMPEVLVAARHLVNGDTIHLAPCGRVTYVHLVFDRHELVWSDGVPSESFFCHAPEATEGPAAEMAMMFPALSAVHHAQIARPALKRHEGALMLA